MYFQSTNLKISRDIFFYTKYVCCQAAKSHTVRNNNSTFLHMTRRNFWFSLLLLLFTYNFQKKGIRRNEKSHGTYKQLTWLARKVENQGNWKILPNYNFRGPKKTSEWFNVQEKIWLSGICICVKSLSCVKIESKTEVIICIFRTKKEKNKKKEQDLHPLK